MHTKTKKIDFILPFKFKLKQLYLFATSIEIYSSNGDLLGKIEKPILKKQIVVRDFKVSSNYIIVILKTGSYEFKKEVTLNILSANIQELDKLTLFIFKFNSLNKRFPLINEIIEEGFSISIIKQLQYFLIDNFIEENSKIPKILLDMYDTNTILLFSSIKTDKNPDIYSLALNSNLPISDLIKTIQFMKITQSVLKKFPYTNKTLAQNVDVLVKQYILKNRTKDWNIFEFIKTMSTTFKMAYLSSILIQDLAKSDFSIKKLTRVKRSGYILSKKKEKEIYLYIKQFQSKFLRNPTIYEILYKFYTIPLVSLIDYINESNSYNLHQSLFPIDTRLFEKISFDEQIDKLTIQIDKFIHFYSNILTNANEMKKHRFHKNRLTHTSTQFPDSIVSIISDYVYSDAPSSIDITKSSDIISSLGMMTSKTMFYDITPGLKVIKRTPYSTSDEITTENVNIDENELDLDIQDHGKKSEFKKIFEDSVMFSDDMDEIARLMRDLQ